MLRQERGIDSMTGILAAMAGVQAGIYTAMPGIIQSFDPVARTCVIQPALKAQVQEPSGEWRWVTMPLLVDCPVIFPSGGGFTLTFPLAAGDECLTIFASRCIDAWWQSGGVQVQADIRMHHLSDGFCLAGVSSKPQVIPAISTANVQLRSDSGADFYELDPAGNARVQASGNVNVAAGGNAVVTAGGQISLAAPVVNIVASSQINFTAPNMVVTTPGGGFSINGIPFNTHKHTGVTTGPSNTGGPTS